MSQSRNGVGVDAACRLCGIPGATFIDGFVLETVDCGEVALRVRHGGTARPTRGNRRRDRGVLGRGRVVTG